MSSTQQVIDNDKIGKRGFPRHYASLGLEPPKKVVPVDDMGQPEVSHPGMTLQQYAAAKRWEKEVGGIEINGLTVSTDDRSKTMISGARVAAQNDPDFTTQWKSSNGSFVTINAAAVIAISDAMLRHVSDCFAIEAQVLAEIEAGTISSLEQIDAAFA